MRKVTEIPGSGGWSIHEELDAEINVTHLVVHPPRLSHSFFIAEEEDRPELRSYLTGRAVETLAAALASNLIVKEAWLKEVDKARQEGRQDGYAKGRSVGYVQGFEAR